MTGRGAAGQRGRRARERVPGEIRGARLLNAVPDKNPLSPVVDAVTKNGRDVPPLPKTEIRLRPQFDRFLILAALLAFASIYLPWLPGLYGAVPGWRVPTAMPDVSLDIIRHLETLRRPESIFLLDLVGILAILFCRTSRHAGFRDQVASLLLVTGGGYTLIYFAHEWAWALAYSYVGPYAALLALGLVIVAGIFRTKFMPWISPGKVLMLSASAFLLTAFFLPWSLDKSGIALMMTARGFYWLGVPKVYAWLMIVFPLLGFVGFISVFHELPKTSFFFLRCWPICVGIAALIYFHSVWAEYLIGFPLGSWGTLSGLVLLVAAGILEYFSWNLALGRFIAWIFAGLNILVWISSVTGSLKVISGFFNAPVPISF